MDKVKYYVQAIFEEPGSYMMGFFNRFIINQYDGLQKEKVLSPSTLSKRNKFHLDIFPPIVNLHSYE